MSPHPPSQEGPPFLICVEQPKEFDCAFLADTFIGPSVNVLANWMAGSGLPPQGRLSPATQLGLPTQCASQAPH